ncbi:MAG TPA: hypothetical protein VFN31_00560 [Candidatus Saccharimonadales bacterium]|nr:hypothetical protein [Candidatus Saccharimonadales bacterium]
MNAHIRVRHPREILESKANIKSSGKVYQANDKLLEWITNHVLASVVLFDIALILPLLAIPASTSIKLTVGVISSSWIQWWALPALQRSQNKIQAQNDAKAEADHETLTYLANLQDKQMAALEEITKSLDKLK